MKNILNTVGGTDDFSDLQFEFETGRLEKMKFDGMIYKHINGRTPKVVIKLKGDLKKFEVKPKTK